MREETEDIVGIEDGRIFRCTRVMDPGEMWLQVEELDRKGGARLAKLHAFVPGMIGDARVFQEFPHLPKRTASQLIAALRRLGAM